MGDAIITQAAVNDLEEFVAYIGRDDPRAAKRVPDDLVSRAESLAKMPGRGKAMRTRPSVKRLVGIDSRNNSLRNLVPRCLHWR